jgi:hypothetical protein
VIGAEKNLQESFRARGGHFGEIKPFTGCECEGKRLADRMKKTRAERTAANVRRLTCVARRTWSTRRFAARIFLESYRERIALTHKTYCRNLTHVHASRALDGGKPQAAMSRATGSGSMK